jgi:outer membrane protein assembly factor BamB
MIRFRLGQSWKREREADAVDAFGLELEGVDLLPQASEESLEDVVTELVDAVHALAVRKERVAQVSLPEAHFELCLLRREGAVELSVAALSRPARVVRRVDLDLADLATATARCARALIADVWERATSKGDALRRKLSRKLAALEAPLGGPWPTHAEPGFSYRIAASGPCSFSVALWDPDDRLRTFRAGGSGALSSLLCDGELSLHCGGSEVWRAKGPPLVHALELARQAAELARANESREAKVTLQLAGAGPAFEFTLQDGRLASAGTPGIEAQALARAVCELGTALAFAVGTRHRTQAKNPYVMELAERAKETLAQLRDAAPPEPGGVALGARTASTGKKLAVAGRLKRLRFKLLWQKQNLGGDTPGQLVLGPKGPVFTSPGMAVAFSRQGDLLFRRVAPAGVAADGAGHVLAAGATRVMGFSGSDEGARWLHDHDGLPLGPQLWARDGIWVTLSESRTVVAFDEVTGREQWRLAPPRTTRCFVSVQAHRALVATDVGLLYGLDLRDGQVRYRLKSSLPFTGPMQPWGRRAVGALSRGDTSALIVTDAHRGNVLWAHDMRVAIVSPPLVARGRVLVAVAPGDDGALVCFTARGDRAWQRPLDVGPGPFSLVAMERAAVVASRTGAATWIEPDGQTRWQVASAGAPLAWPLPPQRSRGLLLLAGQAVRAVEPASGAVLGEIQAGPGLCDIAADARLNLYLLDEDGTLRAYQLSTHLSVVVP